MVLLRAFVFSRQRLVYVRPQKQRVQESVSFALMMISGWERSSAQAASEMMAIGQSHGLLDGVLILNHLQTGWSRSNGQHLWLVLMWRESVCPYCTSRLQHLRSMSVPHSWMKPKHLASCSPAPVHFIRLAYHGSPCPKARSLWAGTVWCSKLRHRVIVIISPSLWATCVYSRLPGQETMVRVIRPLSSLSRRTRAVWVIPHVLFAFTSSRMSPHLDTNREKDGWLSLTFP